MGGSTKVLVTGGAGYIGSVAVRMLLGAGHDVVVFDSLELGHREAVDARASLLVGDLRERGDIDAALRTVAPDAVMHFAAYALVGESMTDPLRYFANNVTGGLNLADAMLRHGVRRIVFSSSCATYGEPERMPISEDTPQRPTNPYGESKLVLERALTWLERRRGLVPTFLRYFNACGAEDGLGEDHDPETHLVPNVLRTALGLQPAVNLYGTDYPTPDGTCVRDYVHVTDLAAAHVAAVEGSMTGAFNLGSGAGASVREVLAACERVCGRPIAVSERDRRPGDPPVLVATREKARQQLGWEPVRSSLDRIVADAWQWHRSHPHGYGEVF